MPKRLVIHPGFVENRLHFRRLVSEMNKEHWDIKIHNCRSKKPSPRADVAVTHSAGIACKDIMRNSKRIIAVAPPLLHQSYNKPLIKKFLGDVQWAALNNELPFWFYKTMISLVILLPFLTYWPRLRNQFTWMNSRVEIFLNSPKVLVVINMEDPWIRPLLKDTRCIQFSGNHDDITYRPKRYKKLILDQ